jgi:hypothetical protein
LCFLLVIQKKDDKCETDNQVTKILYKTRKRSIWTNLLQVTDADGTTVPSQTSPVFQEMSDVIAESHYDITFMADVPPLGLTTYFLHAVLPAQNM